MSKSTILILLSISMLILAILDVRSGSVSVPFAEFQLWVSGGETSDVFNFIVVQSRIPKALTAILCGAALSLAGLLMQTLFRNPLAGPYLLGISSGAGLGVALLVMGAGFMGFVVATGAAINVAAIIGAW